MIFSFSLSAEIYHTVWRTWHLIACSEDSWLNYHFSLHHSYICSWMVRRICIMSQRQLLLTSNLSGVTIQMKYVLVILLGSFLGVHFLAFFIVFFFIFNIIVPSLLLWCHWSTVPLVSLQSFHQCWWGQATPGNIDTQHVQYTEKSEEARGIWWGNTTCYFTLIHILVYNQISSTYLPIT